MLVKVLVQPLWHISKSWFLIPKTLKSHNDPLLGSDPPAENQWMCTITSGSQTKLKPNIKVNQKSEQQKTPVVPVPLFKKDHCTAKYFYTVSSFK